MTALSTQEMRFQVPIKRQASLSDLREVTRLQRDLERRIFGYLGEDVPAPIGTHIQNACLELRRALDECDRQRLYDPQPAPRAI